MEDCPFCNRIAAGEVVRGSQAAGAFPDAYPVTTGHTLVVPRRHVEDLFSLEPPEWAALWAFVHMVQRDLAEQTGAAAWTVGANVGEAAGQTVAHAHVHLIPRRPGDVADPRGGIRWVVPSRADYWSDR